MLTRPKSQTLVRSVSFHVPQPSISETYRKSRIAPVADSGEMYGVVFI